MSPLQQLFRSQNPGLATNPAGPNGAALQQSVPPPPPSQAQQQFLQQQHNAQQAYAAAAAAQAQAATAAAAAGQYVINAGQEPPYMGLIPTPVPQYYNLPWGCYPAGLIQQQGTQPPPPRRPLTPSQQPGADTQPYQVRVAPKRFVFDFIAAIFHARFVYK